MDPSTSTYLQQAINMALQAVPGLYAEMVLAAGILAGLLVSMYPPRLSMWLLPSVCIVAFAVVLFFLSTSTHVSSPTDWLKSHPASRWVQGLSVVVCLALLYPLATDKRLQAESDQRRGERIVFMLSLLLGMFLLVRSSHFLVAYIGIEFMSISSYVLVSFSRREARSAEAGLKFFIFGAFSSGLFLYGVSWLYGLTGTLQFTDPSYPSGLAQAGSAIWLLPSILMLLGLLFKLGAFPMHAWMPDAWEGGTYPVSALLSIVPKAGAFLFLLWVIQAYEGLDGFETLRWLVGLTAIASMTWGNLAALRQTHLRRLLAYSSVAHAGFLLMALSIASTESFQAGLFYLTMYAVMNTAMFFMADGFHRGLGHARWQEWEGRGRLFPWATASMAIILASLTGLPPSGGFIAKWVLFLSALDPATPLTISLVIAAAVNTVLALAYYMVIPSRMVFRPAPLGDAAANRFPAYEWVGGMLLGVTLLIMGIWGFDRLITLFASWF